jgi:O-antigen/teichoic acid export membrane protein
MTGGRKAYWRAVALVFSGTATAQLIPILGSLVIARLFIPAQFGVFMTWFGMVSVAAVITTGRFETALPLESDGAPRAQAASSAFISAGLILAALTCAGMIAWPFAHGYLPEIPVTLVLLYVPAVAAAACVLIFQAWAAAEGRFRALSVMRISQASVITGLQILAGFHYPSATTLAVAHVIGVITGVSMMAWQLRPPSLADGRQTLLRFWKRYRRFPLYALPADTVNTAAAQLPLLIITHRFGADMAGYVAMAFRMLGAPIALMGSAVLDVFKRRASESWRMTGSCRGPYLETFFVLAAGSLAASIAFWWAGVQIFTLAFGPEWAEAGRTAVLLLPLFAMRFVSSPLSYTFYIAEKQSVDLLWQICLLGMTLVTLTALPEYDDTLRTYAFGYGFLYVIYLSLSYRFSAGRTA